MAVKRKVRYLRSVLVKLEGMGYEKRVAKNILLSHWKGIYKLIGTGPNASNFAKMIDEIYRAVLVKYDSNNPNHIFITEETRKAAKEYMR